MPHIQPHFVAASPMPQEPLKVLAVEDESIAMEFLDAQIANLGHEAIHAQNGQQAIDLLKDASGSIDVVLMDREMPVMDGLTAIRLIKKNPALRHIPIIMVTAATSTRDMEEGLNAGVFYYITKPVKEAMLRSVLAAAAQEARQAKRLHEELNRHRTSFDLIQTCRFQFRTLQEAESLAAFIAHCFPDPVRALPGLGELLVNAIEHGNLAIGYETKSQLIENQTWREEIARRQALPENAQKVASATIARKDDGVYAIVEDEGNGFHWKPFLHIDPARAGDSHGRGIAQANATSFDKLTYNETGNKAIAFSSKQRDLEW